MAGASQNKVDFLTSLGHRLYSDDILRTLDEAFGGDDFVENQSDARRTTFSSSKVPRSSRAALRWSVAVGHAAISAPPLLQLTVDRLYHILRPGAYLLAFFNATKRKTAATCSYRIADRKTLLLAPRERTRPVQFMNNRSIEKLFQNFQSLKFFLTRDHLREVIVRR